MKAIELVKIGKVLLEMLSNADIKTEDYKYIQLYEEYMKLRREGNKYDYATAILSKRYKISQATVSRLIRRLSKAVES